MTDNCIIYSSFSLTVIVNLAHKKRNYAYAENVYFYDICTITIYIGLYFFVAYKTSSAFKNDL